MRIAILAESPDWHCHRLAASLRRHGAEVAMDCLRHCSFSPGSPGTGVAMPSFAPGLPDVAVVRFIAAGTFEQVTFRLSILHALHELGVHVVNDARAIERCVDKAMTSFLLHRAGIPTPATLVTELPELAAAWRADQAGDVVAKPLFGAQGRGLRRLTPADGTPDPGESEGVLYLQRYVGRVEAWRDFRVFVIGSEPVAAMARRGANWITNVARGGTCEPVVCRGALADLAAAASKAVGASYSGVDLIEDEHGTLQVLEVNSMPAWKGLQGVAEIDIADALARHVLTL